MKKNKPSTQTDLVVHAAQETLPVMDSGEVLLAQDVRAEQDAYSVKQARARNNPLRKPGAIAMFVLALVSVVALAGNYYVVLGLVLGGLFVLCGILVLLSDNILLHLDAQAVQPDPCAVLGKPKFTPSARTAMRMTLWALFITSYLYFSFAFGSWEYSWMLLAAEVCIEQILLACLDMRRA